MMIGPIEGTTRVKLQASIEESIAAGLLLMNEAGNNDRSERTAPFVLARQCVKGGRSCPEGPLEARGFPHGRHEPHRLQSAKGCNRAKPGVQMLRRKYAGLVSGVTLPS